MVVVVFLVLLTFLSDYLMPSLSWICLVPRLVYPTLILNISQYILSTWQDDWNRAVVNKLQASPGRLAVLLRAVQEVCSCLVSCLHRSYIFDPFIHPKEGYSTSVWALSVHSDSSPHFGEVQSSRSDKKWYLVDVVWWNPFISNLN